MDNYPLGAAIPLDNNIEARMQQLNNRKHKSKSENV